MPATPLSECESSTGPPGWRPVDRDDLLILGAAVGVAGLFALQELRIAGVIGFSAVMYYLQVRFLTDLPKRANVTVPFTPWGAALFKERQDNAGRDRPAGRCLPHSIPNAMLVPLYPWKILQTPEEVVVLYENFTQYRQIFTDGRSLPAQMDPTWFGYSIGRWEGDVLVVDTAGLNDKAWLDDGGHPRSDQMRTTEKFRRKDFGHMEIEFTFNDPKAYTQPWSVTVPFELLPDTDIIENICENEKDVVHIFGK